MTATPLPPPALWHDQTTGHWKVLTKPDRPTYEAYYTAEQVQQARADLEAENERLREALERIESMCTAPPDFSNATIQEVARAALEPRA